MSADRPDYRQSKEADAALYQHKRQTEGMLEMAKGYSALIDVFGGAHNFLQFRMMENGTYEKLAKANGEAINGLQPKITSWNTGEMHSPSFSRHELTVFQEMEMEAIQWLPCETSCRISLLCWARSMNRRVFLPRRGWLKCLTRRPKGNLWPKSPNTMGTTG